MARFGEIGETERIAGENRRYSGLTKGFIRAVMENLSTMIVENLVEKRWKSPL